MQEAISGSVVFPQPKGGASLLLSFRLENRTTLILGSGSLAASRAFSALEADSAVVVLARGGLNAACEELRWRAQSGQLTLLNWDLLPGSSTTSGTDQDIKVLDSYLASTPGISFVCVTDTVFGTPLRRPHGSAAQIYQLCHARNIPVNTTDMPDLCDFSFTSTHRFEDPESGNRTSLQIGVTTNGRGCRLAGRVKREIVSKLPKEIGAAVEKIGYMRALAKSSADAVREKTPDVSDEDLAGDEQYEDSGVTTPNRPVPSRNNTETAVESAKRRMKWVAQISEYWPISKLAGMTEGEMQEVLAGDHSNSNGVQQPDVIPSIHSLILSRPGRILLVGSGPGHPSLLTIATHTALTKLADLVLSDKLVPDAVLALIPKGVQIRIAKKFPGNAEGAQTEMMEAAVEAARRGLTVVRVSLLFPSLLRS